MNNLEQVLPVIVLILAWALLVGPLLYLYRSADKFFNLLSEKYPEYYASIGKPKYFSFRRFFKAQLYSNDLLAKGLPQNFPDDKEAKQKAERIRKLDLKLHVLFIAWIVMIMIFGVTS